MNSSTGGQPIVASQPANSVPLLPSNSPSKSHHVPLHEHNFSPCLSTGLLHAHPDIFDLIIIDISSAGHVIQLRRIDQTPFREYFPYERDAAELHAKWCSLLRELRAHNDELATRLIFYHNPKAILVYNILFVEYEVSLDLQGEHFERYLPLELLPDTPILSVDQRVAGIVSTFDWPAPGVVSLGKRRSIVSKMIKCDTGTSPHHFRLIALQLPRLAPSTWDYGSENTLYRPQTFYRFQQSPYIRFYQKPRDIIKGVLDVAMFFEAGRSENLMQRPAVPASAFVEDLIWIVLHQNNDQFIKLAKEPWLILRPMIQLEAICLFALYRRTREVLDRDRASIASQWSKIRNALSDWQALLEAYQYMAKIAGLNLELDDVLEAVLLNDANSFKLERPIIEYMIKNLQRLDSHAKDDFQIEMTNASLREAQKSIEQSEISIEEGRRIKLITVLAFIFVPVSLATSIFGMNLQELNAEGQPVWIFVLTMLSILLSSVVVWIVSYNVHKIHTATRSDYDFEEKGFWVAMGAAFRLLSRGHVLFAFRSGILLSLYTYGRIGFLRPENCCRRRQNVEHRRHDHSHSPIFYIMEHSNEEAFAVAHLKYFKPSSEVVDCARRHYYHYNIFRRILTNG